MSQPFSVRIEIHVAIYHKDGMPMSSTFIRVLVSIITLHHFTKPSLIKNHQ